MLYICEQIKKHPATEWQDIIKLCYQAAFGAEHILEDAAAAKKYFFDEFSSVDPAEGELYEMISDDACRVNLAVWKTEGLPAKWLFEMFRLSAKVADNGESLFLSYLEEAKSLFPDFGWYAEAYLAGGIRAVHHSNAYREAEKPHYRIVNSRFIRIIPILMQMAKLNSANAKIVAIDGRAASGKTTAAKLLSQITGASVIHMDDFFLPPELRNEKRFSEPGGNVHYERFASEVLPKLRSGTSFSYGKFDCSAMMINGSAYVPASEWIIVEGSYSLHPRFGDYADITVFSDIAPDEQLRRIIMRNGEKMAETFRTRWIPMEELYFTSLSLPSSCILLK